jgi:exonuclease SbcC
VRPLRLEVEGFTSFRSPTVVDFADAEYFALVGPTGSGKSSLIDAIGFALYGSVPRYDDRRLVAPVISQGQTEARVGLDFAVGAQAYRAVRVVRAQARGKGATTKEARLERVGPPGGDEVLAGDADGLTEAVTRLLGLTFDHFTKCVVLPQGTFARFLHDKPAARQDLLVELLGLGLYGQLGQAANAEAATALNRSAIATEQLTRPPLSDATPEAVASARQRVVEIDALRTQVAEAEPMLLALADRQAEALAESAGAGQRAALLAAVTAPEGLTDLASALARAVHAVTAANDEVDRAETGVAVAEAALEAMASRSALEGAERQHQEREDLRARLEKGRLVTVELVTAERQCGQDLEAARDAVTAARAEWERAGQGQQATALARVLIAGQPCPVCRQAVATLPDPVAAPDLDAAEMAVSAAERRLGETTEAAQEASPRRAKGEQVLATLSERVDELEVLLAEQPDRTAVVAALARLSQVEANLSAARTDERRARAEVRDAQRRQTQIDQQLHAARAEFDSCRDRLASLGPPVAQRLDVAADWADLVDWAALRVPIEQEEAAGAASRAEEITTQRQTLTDALEAACGAVGIELGPHHGRPGEAVAEARADAVGVASRLADALAEAERVAAQVSDLATQAQVARALGQHLRSSGFEKWLLDEAISVLVTGATALLRELSSGAYSLAIDPAGGFAVVDHGNADAVRSARTLSGGETFLASLALALALADRLAEYAAEGAAPLEAIFLDEGFGTLDAETLDTVAAAIENLAASGRVVGLVTHVRELADRVPVRFEVERGPGSSTVRRVEL